MKNMKATKKAAKNLEEFADLTEKELRERIHFLQKANSRLSASADKKSIAKTELVEAVYRAVSDVLPGMLLDPVPVKKDYRKCKRQSMPETAIIMTADWQLGKRTPTYNTAKCEDRMHQFADKVCYLTDIQRADHPVREARIYALGDLPEGELIYPGQSHQIDSSLFRQVCVDGPRILGDFTRRMLGHFDSVHVIGVTGNHGAIGGRQRKEMHPETNADRMIYNITEKVLANEKRLSWYIPDMIRSEEMGFWYALDQVGKKTNLLFHGHQMRGGGFAGLPFYGFYRALALWGSGVLPGEAFDYAMCGHWHQCSSLLLNRDRILFISGSPESHNTWAAEELKQRANPSQYLLFMHPENGVTSEYRVWLK